MLNEGATELLKELENIRNKYGNIELILPWGNKILYVYERIVRGEPKWCIEHCGSNVSYKVDYILSLVELTNWLYNVYEIKNLKLR